jgi:hypothetical protein
VGGVGHGEDPLETMGEGFRGRNSRK